MIGLANMAMCLAERRATTSTGYFLTGFWTRHKIEPCNRDVLCPPMHPVSAEYYAIIDRITRGERP